MDNLCEETVTLIMKIGKKANIEHVTQELSDRKKNPNRCFKLKY